MVSGFWLLSDSSIKNSASTEQKVKPKVNGEAILRGQKQAKDSQNYIEQRNVRREIDISRREKKKEIQKGESTANSGNKSESKNRF